MTGTVRLKALPHMTSLPTLNSAGERQHDYTMMSLLILIRVAGFWGLQIKHLLKEILQSM
jgi:hypothetical protein